MGGSLPPPVGTPELLQQAGTRLTSVPNPSPVFWVDVMVPLYQPVFSHPSHGHPVAQNVLSILHWTPRNVLETLKQPPRY